MPQPTRHTQPCGVPVRAVSCRRAAGRPSDRSITITVDQIRPMAARKSAARPKPPAKRAKPARKSAPVFTAEERAAMRDYVREKKAAARGADAAADAQAVLDKIAAMPEPDRAMAARVHAIVTAAAPALAPRLWYGMPAYAKNGQVVCFFQDAKKFKSRYATLGFSDKAKLDDGAMWPTSFALTEPTRETDARIAALVKRAVT